MWSLTLEGWKFDDSAMNPACTLYHNVTVSCKTITIDNLHSEEISPH
jgi:hypothetical protein